MTGLMRATIQTAMAITNHAMHETRTARQIDQR
jgi:hypothetical protein